MSTFSNKSKATGQVSGKPQAAIAALPEFSQPFFLEKGSDDKPT